MTDFVTPDERLRITQSGRLKPGSQNARIVAALTVNGGWMTTAEIHAHAGFSRLNSRIAELREHGYVIPSRHVDGQVGPHGTEYRLIATPDEAALDHGLTAETAPVHAASSGASSAEPREVTAAQVPVQLDLLAQVAA